MKLFPRRQKFMLRFYVGDCENVLERTKIGLNIKWSLPSAPANFENVWDRDVKFECTGNAPGRVPGPRRAFAGPNVRRAGLVWGSA